MTTVSRLYSRMIESMGVEGLEIPATYARLYPYKEAIPEKVATYYTEEETVMCCQATRHASHGSPVLLTIDNIGCVAAAISLGLVDQHQASPLVQTPRLYTDLMQKQSGLGPKFIPPAPEEFTTGVVYACRSTGREDYCLFGKEDSGRFKDVETAKKAVAEMMAIQPPTIKGVFFFSNGFEELDLIPDVVLLSVRPVELTRIIQGYQYITGKRVNSSMGPLRVVDSDLIVRPYLTQEINVSTFCLGARLVARFEGDRLGIGIPFNKFEQVIQGMEQSRTGYPFPKYPGASD